MTMASHQKDVSVLLNHTNDSMISIKSFKLKKKVHIELYGFNVIESPPPPPDILLKSFWRHLIKYAVLNCH